MEIKILKENLAKSIMSLVDLIDKMLRDVEALGGKPSKDMLESICGLRRARDIVKELPSLAEINRLKYALTSGQAILRALAMAKGGLSTDFRYLKSQQFLDEMRAWITELEPDFYRFHKPDIEKAFARFEKLRGEKGVRRGILRLAYAEFEQAMLVAEEKQKVVLRKVA